MHEIFVCYSRSDTKWFEEGGRHDLIPWLQEVLKPNKVTLWYDTGGIPPGEQWREAILAAIDRADVALLLVNETFLTSEFICNTELPAIKERMDNGGLAVIPILLEQCSWDNCPFIARMQFLPHSKPLIDFTNNDSEWSQARHQILKAIRNKLSEPRAVAQPTMQQVPPAVSSSLPGSEQPNATAAAASTPPPAPPALAPPAAASGRPSRQLLAATGLAVALLIVAAAFWALLRGRDGIAVTMTAPLAKDLVQSVTQCSGTISPAPLPDGKALWLFVQPQNAPAYHPQSVYLRVSKAGGAWSGRCQFGESASKNRGEKFDLLAVVVDANGDQIIKTYLRDAEKNQVWNGMDRLPSNAQILAVAADLVRQ
jgi:hypothetical protein